MIYCRIDLSQTNYKTLPNSEILSIEQRIKNFSNIENIYKKYCKHKNFLSVMPLFPSIVYATDTDCIVYKFSDDIIAFSLVKKYDNYNIESMQFAWNYENPKLRLGIKSLEHECAFYKNLSYKYLYLGEVDKYKTKFLGFEIVKNNI